MKKIYKGLMSIGLCIIMLSLGILFFRMYTSSEEKIEKQVVIEKQVEEVKRWENNINDLKDIVPKTALEQIKLRYKIELNKLDNICNSNRKSINNYYIANINTFSNEMSMVATR